MAIKASIQTKLARALGDTVAANEVADAIDANTALLDVTPGTVEANKALVPDASSTLDALTITTLTAPTVLQAANTGGTEIATAGLTVRTVVRKDAIVDNTATSFLTFTCPNAAHGAVCKVTILAQVADQESVRGAVGLVVLSRVAGNNLVAEVASLALEQIATGDAETLTLAYDMGTVNGDTDAENTIDMRLTLNSDGSTACEAIVVVEFINAEASGITVGESG